MFNKNIIPIMSLLLAGSLYSCNKEKIVINDVPQSTDTITVVERYAEALWQPIDRNTLPSDAAGFNPLGFCISGDTLYISNWTARTIEVYDAKNMTYSHTIYANESGRTLNSRDVCVSDSLLFVTSGNPSQVSVYNRFTEEYLCRLGDGSTSGSVQQANSVAVDSNFVYVRDQSELLKLFDRKEINEAIAKKQKNVSPKYKYSIPSSVSISQDYDMQAVDGYLLAANNMDKTLYVYSCDADTSLYEVKSLKYTDNTIPYGIAASEKYIFISTEGVSAGIHAYNRKSFFELDNLDEPEYTLNYTEVVGLDNALEFVHFMDFSNDSTLFVRQNGKIQPLLLRERHYHIITPVLVPGNTDSDKNKNEQN